MSKAINAKKAAISAMMIERLNVKLASEKTNTRNQKLIAGYISFFEYNDDALTALAKDDANLDYLAKQIYACTKLTDFVRVALAGRLNVEGVSIMHHFLLRVIKTLDNMRNASVLHEADLNEIINCAMNGSIQPKSKHAAMYMRSDNMNYSSENAQRPQVLNVLRTLRIVNENDDKNSFNLETDLCKKMIAVLVNYDGKTKAA